MDIMYKKKQSLQKNGNKKQTKCAQKQKTQKNAKNSETMCAKNQRTQKNGFKKK